MVNFTAAQAKAICEAIEIARGRIGDKFFNLDNETAHVRNEVRRILKTLDLKPSHTELQLMLAFEYPKYFNNRVAKRETNSFEQSFNEIFKEGATG